MCVNRRVFFLADLYGDEVLNVKIAYADKIIGPPCEVNIGMGALFAADVGAVAKWPCLAENRSSQQR